MNAMIETMITGGEDDKLCHWFVFCFNPAVETRAHPILGSVPVCRAHTGDNFPTEVHPTEGLQR